jgi:ubiquitin-activating enzyme E1
VTVSMASSSSFGELPRRDHVVTFSDVQGTTDDKKRPLHFRVASHPKQQEAVGDAILWRFDLEPMNGSHCSIEVCAGKGHLRRHILPERFTFSSLSHSLQAPGSLTNREWKVYGRSEQLHVAFAALHQFAERNSGVYPNPRVPSDLDAYLDLCRSLYSSFPDFSGGMDEGVMRSFARSFAGLLNPISAILGALAAQEAIKRLSEKYFPVCDPQWFYFEALDTLPEVSKWQDQTEFEPQHCRYDDQIVLLGRRMQALIGSSKVFMIGAGALGCELLKNFAMMGVACGETGLLTITDNDHIEKSNLSRQFLFRAHHIKRSKSECASEAVRLMNPSFK